MGIFEIEPFERFGPVRFRMTRQEIAAALGPWDRASPPFLWYAELGLKIEVTAGAGCVYAEAVLGRTTPVFGGVELDGPFDATVAALRSLGFDAVFGTGANCGLVDFPSLGISLWREDPDLDAVDAVGVWARQYR